MTPSPCNFCGSTQARPRLHGYGFDRSTEAFDIHECLACGLAFVDPLPAADKLAAYYGAEYYGSPEAKFTGPMEALVRQANARRARALVRRVSSAGVPPRVLDVGCGRGLFLQAMHALGWQAVGTELPGFAFPRAGPLDLIHARAEALPLGPDSFDAVSIWHVLEHTTDPAAVLRGIARVLKPGGVLALAVPNFGSWQARLFGRHWFHLDLPRHLYHFRLAPLRRFLQEQQIDVIDVRTQSWDQNLYGFVQSCLNAVYWRTAPNGLYQVLKAHKGRRRAGLRRLACYLVLAAAAAPCAVVENLAATAAGRGATLILYARKRHENEP